MGRGGEVADRFFERRALTIGSTRRSEHPLRGAPAAGRQCPNRYRPQLQKGTPASTLGLHGSDPPGLSSLGFAYANIYYGHYRAGYICVKPNTDARMLESGHGP